MSDIMPSPEMIPVFASTKINLHPDTYLIVSLPLSMKERALDTIKQLDPFSSVTIDYDEVSLILHSTDWEVNSDAFPSSKTEGPYKAITFDIVLDLNLVGFLSIVSSILAEAGISIFTLSTYLRDHILVKESDAEKTVQLLEDLILRCKSIN